MCQSFYFKEQYNTHSHPAPPLTLKIKKGALDFKEQVDLFKLRWVNLSRDFPPIFK